MTSDADYAKQHKLKELFEYLMEQVLNRKPANHEGFIINLLTRRQNMMSKTSTTKTPSSQKLTKPGTAPPKPSKLQNQTVPSRPSTAQPTSSKLSPRNRKTHYDRPWMSQSLPKGQTDPLTKTAKTGPLIKTAKTLDLTVSSRQANFANTVKLNQSKEAKEMVNQMSKKVTNKAIQIGKRNYVVDESEEIKLKFDKDFNKQSKKQSEPINAKEQLDLHRAKKATANEMRTKTVQKNVAKPQKPVQKLNVAEELPGPKEVPKMDNPFDLQIEGLTLTDEQRSQAKYFEMTNNDKLKVDMDNMINKISKKNTTDQINRFLEHDQNQFASPPMSTRSLVSVSALETREWKMTDAF